MAEPTLSKCTPPPKGSELLRESLFNDRVVEDEGELLKRREPTMLRRGKKLVAPPSDGTKKYTVVFDLDETVVYARDGPLYARAYLKDLFRSIKDDFEVIVWTAGERDYAKCVLEEINEDHIIDHLVYRHKKWFNEEDYTKDLRQLGRDLNYTIMIENTPDCVRANPQNGIIVEDFEVLPETTDDEVSVPPTPLPTPPPQHTPAFPATEDGTEGPTTSSTVANPVSVSSGAVAAAEDGAVAIVPKRRRTTDRTLFLLREVLASLVQSGETVPVFLASCDLLCPQTVAGSDGNDIPIYHLGTRRRRKDAGAPRKVVKANRDKSATAAAAPAPVEESQKGADEQPSKNVVLTDGSATGGKQAKPVSETSMEEMRLLPPGSADSVVHACNDALPRR